MCKLLKRVSDKRWQTLIAQILKRMLQAPALFLNGETEQLSFLKPDRAFEFQEQINNGIKLHVSIGGKQYNLSLLVTR